jgi:hypothetical protein
MMAIATSETAAASTIQDAAAALIAQAHQRAVTTTPTEMASRMQDLFGQNLTALVCGLDNPKTVGKWAHGQMPHASNLTRLRNAFQIATLLELAESRQTAQAWFMGLNPDLGDRAPALVLADDPDDAPRVMRAARAFLAHG